MAFEIETKILNVDPKLISKLMKKMGAEKIQESRLVVDWFRVKGWGEGEDEWFLRIRTYSDGKSEATWKGISKKVGVGIKHKEINVWLENGKQLGDLFEAIGLEKYAHQEKDRVSWKFENWRFDMDSYPGMPTYLEVEVIKPSDIKKAIEKLRLQNHKTSNNGERILIQKEYGLDWYDMRF
jgi:Adenylate cyclase, class 2 (thermophilic)